MSRRRRGFTLIEAVVATIIVATMFVASMTALGVARAGETLATNQTRGLALAQDLMSEILQRRFEESAGATIGLDGNDTGTTRKARFDDVDDYHNLSETPPVRDDGAAIAGGTGWARSVQVQWVSPTAPDTAAAANSGAKRVTVTVTYAGRVTATLTAVRAKAWQDPTTLRWTNP